MNWAIAGIAMQSASSKFFPKQLLITAPSAIAHVPSSSLSRSSRRSRALLDHHLALAGDLAGHTIHHRC
jgi:hypothetical protein